MEPSCILVGRLRLQQLRTRRKRMALGKNGDLGLKVLIVRVLLHLMFSSPPPPPQLLLQEQFQQFKAFGLVSFVWENGAF